MFPKADEQFQANRKADGKTPGSLLELYTEKKADLTKMCVDSKVKNLFQQFAIF